MSIDGSFACRSSQARAMISASFRSVAEASRRSSRLSSRSPIQLSGWHTRCTIIVQARCAAIATHSFMKAWQSSLDCFSPCSSKGASRTWSLPKTCSSCRLLKTAKMTAAKDLFVHPACSWMLAARSLVASKTARWLSRSGFSAK